jgi:hypothetical protein
MLKPTKRVEKNALFLVVNLKVCGHRIGMGVRDRGQMNDVSNARRTVGNQDR